MRPERLQRDTLPVPLPAQAVIFAGGEGRRLAPLTRFTPKPLLPLGGRCVLDFVLSHLRSSGIDEVVVAACRKADLMRDRYGSGSAWGVRIEYVDEAVPMGTAGALALLRQRPEQPFFVVNGDVLTKCDLRAMWEFHRRVDVDRRAPAMTVGVVPYQVKLPFGEIELDGDRLVSLREKPVKEIMVNAGIYILDPSCIDLIPAASRFDVTDLIHSLLERNRIVRSYPVREYWLDVGSPNDLEKADRDIAQGLLD